MQVYNFQHHSNSDWYTPSTSDNTELGAFSLVYIDLIYTNLVLWRASDKPFPLHKPYNCQVKGLVLINLILNLTKYDEWTLQINTYTITHKVGIIYLNRKNASTSNNTKYNKMVLNYQTFTVFYNNGIRDQVCYLQLQHSNSCLLYIQLWLKIIGGMLIKMTMNDISVIQICRGFCAYVHTRGTFGLLVYKMTSASSFPS
jgi:hypothetical protein